MKIKRVCILMQKKREKYWKFKAAEEKKTKNIVQEDESDLLDMFNELDKGTGPRLLMERNVS